MSPEIRERLAKAAYNASREAFGWEPTWEETSEQDTREVYRIEAEAVALALAEIVLPAFQQAVFALTGSQVEVRLEERRGTHEHASNGDIDKLV